MNENKTTEKIDERTNIRSVLPQESNSKGNVVSIPKKVLQKDNKGLHAHKPDYPTYAMCATTLFHRTKTGEIKSFTSKFKRQTKSNEQHYLRRYTLKVSDDWQKINLAWVENPTRVLIRNEGGRPLQVIPTQEQLIEALSKEVEIGIGVNRNNDTLDIHSFAIIKPDEDISFTPTNTKLYIRNRIAEVDITIFAIEG